MNELTKLSYDLSLLGAIVALETFAVRRLLSASYSHKPKKWKDDAYKRMWQLQNIGTAVSAIGGVLLLLYIYLEVRG